MSENINEEYNNSDKQIHKENLTQNKSENTIKEGYGIAFKIIKKRSPWMEKEDKAIVELVSKNGTGNWTLIANEMASIYGFKSRSGKQCRERWHNHLDPKVSKDDWTEKEEKILIEKHLELGNKWSDIAKYLPGRTDNSIKNHFYSKFRKHIRKIIKQINKENIFKNNGIDPNYYDGDRIYKLLKKYKIQYKVLDKDTIINLILSVENMKKNNFMQTDDDYSHNTFLQHKIKRSFNSINNPSFNHNLTNHNEYSESDIYSHHKDDNNKLHKSKYKIINKKKKEKELKFKQKNTIKKKINKSNNNISYKKTKNIKKRRKRRRRKISISISTPENKRTQIERGILLY